MAHIRAASLPFRKPFIECNSTSGSSTETNASKSRSLKARMNSRTGSEIFMDSEDVISQAGRGTQGRAVRGAHFSA